MRLCISLFIYFISFSLYAQLQIDKNTFDHGVIREFNNDTACFTVTNTGSVKAILLPTQPVDHYSILTSSREILPSGTIDLCVVYYTDKKGKFEIDIPVYFSTMRTPLKFRVKGNIKTILETAYTKCPSIENSRPLKASQIPLNIIVKDKDNEIPIAHSKISLQQKNETITCVRGYSSLSNSCKCDYGFYTMNVEADGYKPHESQIQYNEDNHLMIVYLSKLEESDTAIVNTTIPEPELFPEYIPVAYKDSGFDSDKYKPNHLIFIIDVSGSMKDSTKLDYLKKSIKELISHVRSKDYITLITYSARVKVIFEHYNGAGRDRIMGIIDSLTAYGGSNGAGSMKTAYELAKKHFIVNGNNQIFLATDGLFNSSSISDRELYSLVRRHEKQDGIKFSGIGFGNDENALDFLRKLSALGNGSFLQILDPLRDIHILFEEVKKQSSS